jgi:hypothetical protein
MRLRRVVGGGDWTTREAQSTDNAKRLISGASRNGAYRKGVFSVGSFASFQPPQPPRRAAVFLNP